MFYDFLQRYFHSTEDDVATGTYADGMMEASLGDLSARPRERHVSLRSAAFAPDYGMLRKASQSSAGMVA